MPHLTSGCPTNNSFEAFNKLRLRVGVDVVCAVFCKPLVRTIGLLSFCSSMKNVTVCKRILGYRWYADFFMTTNLQAFVVEWKKVSQRGQNKHVFGMVLCFLCIRNLRVLYSLYDPYIVNSCWFSRNSFLSEVL